MYINFTIPHNQLQKETRFSANLTDSMSFSHTFCGKYSYAVRINIDSGLEYTLDNGYINHNFHIGNFNCIGQNLEIVLGRNHSTKGIELGAAGLLFEKFGKRPQFQNTYSQKSSVIIQNDVWLGENVTIMPNVIIRNGAVIARNSHVVKDVPPYAIVGGNPAKVIKYRFSEVQIQMLQEIAWWHWETEKILENSNFFTEDVDSFCEKFYPPAHAEWEKIRANRNTDVGSFFCFVDFYDDICHYPLIIEQFTSKYASDSGRKLILFVQDDCDDLKINEELFAYLSDEISLINQKSHCQIQLIRGNDTYAKEKFINCENFIMLRTYRTAYYTCLADLLGIRLISGVDVPLIL